MIENSSVIKPISIQRRRLQIVNNHVEKFPASPPSEIVVEPAIKIGIIGFGNFGQFLARAFQRQGHSIVATSRSDYSDYCLNNGIEFFRDVDGLCEAQPDVVLVCSSIVSTENVVRGIPFHKLKPDTIFADVLSVKQFPRNLFLEVLPEEFGILCTHPMFGPNSGEIAGKGHALYMTKFEYQNQKTASRIGYAPNS
ncbi:Prephenate dehydrogenase [Macleaya cordata]|uniref:Prephenate dehydrogenase n=1 Tax=Macleaya cordata TaxID=56857 RepID=A0A200QN22_MACCD|nr:Prephenate dehydrogenase [Macleaya cordata]